MSQLLEKANEYVENHTKNVDETFKPNVHFTAPVGWINDPNGFVFFRGEYHLFYQYNPYDTVWGPMHWGHAKSTDLVNWEHLPVALAPDQPYDKNGCFSGSAIVKDDTLWLMYTGHIEQEDGSIRQIQNMAYSTDGINFTKLESNPVATGDCLPEELVVSDFRDPKLFEKNGRYYSVVAAKHRDDIGGIVLLGSDDLVEWKFESIFLKGEKHQGFMWECPDYFELDGESYLAMSPMRYEKDGAHFVNLNSSVIFKGSVDWNTKQFIAKEVTEIDHGHDYYAPQTCLSDKGERVIIAWMHTWGRTNVMHELQHNWACNMTIPRVLEVENNKVYQRLPKGIIEKLPQVSVNESIEHGVFEFETNDSFTFQLGTTDDYISFGYDADKQEVFVDRKHLKRVLIGEEAWDTTVRSVPVSLDKLTVVIDKNSIELFINDGEETLTSVHYIEGEHILRQV